MKKRIDWLVICVIILGFICCLPVVGDPMVIFGSHGGGVPQGFLKSNTTTYDFGTVTATATATYSFTVTAFGTTIYPSLAYTGTNTSNFTYTHNVPATMDAGSTALITATFQPDTTTGAKNATIGITYTW